MVIVERLPRQIVSDVQYGVSVTIAYRYLEDGHDRRLVEAAAEVLGVRRVRFEGEHTVGIRAQAYLHEAALFGSDIEDGPVLEARKQVAR
jgi:hypothetical protein